MVMVDCDAGQRGDHGVCDSRSVEGIRVTDWEQQPGYSGQRGDMRRTDRLDSNVGVGSWVAGRDGMGIRGGLDGDISGTCWWFGTRRGCRRGSRGRRERRHWWWRINGRSVVPGIVGVLRRGWRGGGRLALRLEELICHAVYAER